MSGSPIHVPDANDEDFEGTSQVEPAWVPDDADDYDEDYDYTLPSPAKPCLYPPSTSTSDSSQTLTFSSKLSHPSGLLVDTVAGLTHDELLVNPEFVKYVSLVGSLQELINLQSGAHPSSSESFFRCSCHIFNHFVLYLQLSL